MKLQVPFIVFPLFASAQSLGGGTRFSISHSGRGCPVGSMSVSASMSPDREIMTLSFDKMQAFIGPGYDATSKTQNCGINLTMELPNDSTQYTLVENTYHGYERLEKGITATLLSTLYRSENATASITTQASVEGSSVGQVFTRTVVVPESQYVWSRCGGSSTLWTLNERVALTSRVRDVEGRFGGEEDGAPLTRQLRFIYRACN